MNQVVITALKRPYTFVVLSIFIVIFGVRSVLKTPTDVFPNINIPVVAIVWSYLALCRKICQVVWFIIMNVP